MDGQNPKSKITIKPFRQQVVHDERYAQSTILKLRDSFEKILELAPDSVAWEERYRDAYNLVLHKYGRLVYDTVVSAVTTRLETVVGILSAVEGDMEFLKELLSTRDSFQTALLMIRDTTMYMERVYIPQNPPLLGVVELGRDLFKHRVLENSNIKKKLTYAFVNLLHAETSRHDAIGILQSITQMLVDFGVFTKDFEKPILDGYKQLYIVDVREFVKLSGFTEYGTGIEDCYSDMQQVQQVDISNIFNIRERLANAANKIFHIIVANVVGVNMEPDNSVQYFLDAKDRYDKLVSDYHANPNIHNNILPNTLNRAFSAAISVDRSLPEHLSLFLNKQWKKILKNGPNNKDTDQIFDKVASLIKYIQDKDVFEQYYRRSLAKRLLFGKTEMYDAEWNMIAKLKSECGTVFTSKIEGMFLDVKLSRETAGEFKAHAKQLEGNPLKNLDLQPFVLTAGYWPALSSSLCNLPMEVAVGCDVFSEFYKTKHNGRHLKWQVGMGNAELMANFALKRHQITVSTYQMVILLLFNERTHISYHDLKEATGISPHSLDYSLSSLLAIKHKILEKEGGGSSSSFEQTDIFTLNSKFNSNSFKVKVLPVIRKETPAEEKETLQELDKSRNFQIEAAIVRVMKAHKTLEHNNLQVEVTKQLSNYFLPNPQAIKKRIESLIDRDYLARSDSDKNIFVYVL